MREVASGHELNSHRHHRLPIVSTQISMELNMVPDDQKTEVVPSAEVPEDLPLPSDPKVIFLGGLFVLAMLAAAYIASEIVLPLVFAIVLKLLLQPALRVLERLHVPRILAALLLPDFSSTPDRAVANRSK